MKQLNQVDKLEAILELSKLLNSTKETSVILKTLIKRSLDLIEGGDTGVIFIYNQDNGFLEPKAYIGFDASIEKIHLQAGESMSGLCFMNKKSMLVDSPEKVKQLVSNMSKENQQIVQSFQTKQFNKVLASILCPLMHKEEAIGVIVIDNYENNARLTEEDVKILEAISIQATIALVNAMHFEQEQRNQAHLKALNRLLEEEKNKYRASFELQTLFTNMALESYSLREILESLHLKLSMDCFLMGFHKQIIEAITPTLSLNANTSSLDEIIQSSPPTQEKSEPIPLDDGFWLRYYPIHINSDHSAWLGIVNPHRELSDLEQLTLEHAIIAFALELLKANDMRLQEESYKGDFLDAILSNQDYATLKLGAVRYGFNIEHNHQFIFIGEDVQSVDLTDASQHQRLHHRLIDIQEQLDDMLQKAFPGSMSLIKDNLLIAVLEFKPKKLYQDHYSVLNRFLNHVNILYTPAHPVFCALGPLITPTDSFNDAYLNTRLGFKTAIELKRSQSPFRFDELEVKKLLMKNSRDVLESFLNRVLGPLNAYEKKSKQEFLHTLRLYITSNRNWTTTKHELHIHGNTLNYRLNRISEILDVDLDDYSQRLKLQMAFEILDILELKNK